MVCERSFFTLKYLKNRLRNYITNEYSECFIVMAIENNILIELENEKNINLVDEKSKVL